MVIFENIKNESISLRKTCVMGIKKVPIFGTWGMGYIVINSADDIFEISKNCFDDFKRAGFIELD